MKTILAICVLLSSCYQSEPCNKTHLTEEKIEKIAKESIDTYRSHFITELEELKKQAYLLGACQGIEAVRKIDYYDTPEYLIALELYEKNLNKKGQP